MGKNNFKDFIRLAFFMIITFAFGGAGLSILFNSKGDIGSVIGGFVLIAIAITVIYKFIIENE